MDSDSALWLSLSVPGRSARVEPPIDYARPLPWATGTQDSSPIISNEMPLAYMPATQRDPASTQVMQLRLFKHFLLTSHLCFTSHLMPVKPRLQHTQIRHFPVVFSSMHGRALLVLTNMNMLICKDENVLSITGSLRQLLT